MTSLPAPQWLCFDLDGTLIDSAPDLTISLNCMLSALHLKLATEDQVRNWIGNGALKLIQRALAHGQLTHPEKKEIDRAKELFFSAYEANVANCTRVYPDSHAVLKQLQKGGVRLACVTNKPRQFVEPLLRELKLKVFFDSLVCGDDLPVKKPDPEPLLHAIGQLGGVPDQGYMVGDSEIDLIAAQAAGAGAIYATYGYNRGVCVDQHEPIRIDRLRELLQLFTTTSALDVSTSY